MVALTAFAGDAAAAVRQALPFAIPALILLLLLIEQLAYVRKKGPLPGPSTVAVPFLGSALRMVADPTGFWFKQAARAEASGLGLAADYILGRYILFIRDSALSQEVFANVRSDAFHLVMDPFGKKLFSKNNIVYLLDQMHRDLRRRVAPIFSSRALAAYFPVQERVIAKHLRLWLDATATSPDQPVALRPLFRDLNLETSQDVFAGPYLPPAARRTFAEDFLKVKIGLMSVPVDLPGFAFHRARRVMAQLVETMVAAVRASKTCMGSGSYEEPGCLIDFWNQEVLKEHDNAAAGGGSPPSLEISDEMIGGQVFDFFFAGQDTLTSSLCWSVVFLSANPDVVERVRSEVASVGAPTKPETLLRLQYTHAVAKEVLRIRPPVLAVTHVAAAPFRLKNGYTVPKGTIVFPSISGSSFQGFTEPDRFDPARFMEPRNEGAVFKKHFLTFGAGPHQCIGQLYAVNFVALFIASFVSEFDFRRHLTEGCDDIVYDPTTFPKDGCTVVLRRRLR